MLTINERQTASEQLCHKRVEQHSRVKLLILTISSTYTPLTVSVPFKRVEYATETQFSILLYLLKYKFPTNHSFAYFLRYS
jgi:hypothetical protein